jgi:hypothetical protein
MGLSDVLIGLLDAERKFTDGYLVLPMIVARLEV